MKINRAFWIILVPIFFVLEAYGAGEAQNNGDNSGVVPGAYETCVEKQPQAGIKRVKCIQLHTNSTHNLIAGCPDDESTDEGKKCRKYVDEVRKNSNTGSADKNKCEEAFEEFKTAESTLDASCRRVSTGGGCRKQADKCLACMGGAGSDGADLGYSSHDCSSDKKDSTLSFLDQINPNPQPNVKQPKVSLVRKYQSCPFLAGEDLKDMEEKVKSDKKEISDLEENIRNLEKEVSDKQAEIKARDNKYKVDQTALNKDRDDKKKKINEVLEQLIQERQNQVNEQNNIVVQQEDKLRLIDLAKREAKNKLIDGIDQLEVSCMNRAQAALDKKRAEVKQLISQGRYQAKSFSGLLGQAQLTAKQKSRNFIKKQYTYCLKGDFFKRRKQGQERSYKGAISKLNNDKKRANELIKAAREELKSIQAALPEDKKSVIQNLIELEKSHQEQLKALYEAYVAEREKLFTDLHRMQKALIGPDAKPAQLAQLKKDHQELLQMYNLKKKLSGGKSHEASEVQSVFVDLDSLGRQARSVEVACECDSETPAANKAACKRAENWKSARDGGDLDDDSGLELFKSDSTSSTQ